MCYKFAFEPTTWGEARADCLSTEGADLLAINTPAELAFINNTGAAFSPWWIGKLDSKSEKKKRKKKTPFQY